MKDLLGLAVLAWPLTLLVIIVLEKIGVRSLILNTRIELWDELTK